MSEVAAPAAPAAPAAAAPEVPKHHAQNQPRTPQGQFTQPAAPTAETPLPPRYRVGDREYDNPEELAADAQGWHVEHSALTQNTQALQKMEMDLRAAREELERARRGETLDEQTRIRIAIEQARRYQEEQEIAALPEDQRRLYLHMRQVQKEAADYKAQIAAIEKQRADAEERAKQEADQKAGYELQQKLKGEIRTAMEATGLAPSNDLARMVSAEMRAALMAGVEYPPEVLARRVLKRFNATVSEQVKARAAKPETLFRDIPSLVDALNNLEDPAILRLLGPKLGERLRRLNLETSGLRPQVVPSPTAPVSGSAAGLDTKDLKPGDPRWEEVIRARSRG